MRSTARLCILAIVLGLAGLMVYSVATLGDAFADGSGSAVSVPSDSIDDPIAAPGAAWDDVKAAKKVGWPIAALVVIIIASRLLARLGGKFEFLGKGKVSLVIGAVGAFSIAAYNAVMLEGSWLAAGTAAIVAAAAYWDSAAKDKAEPVA